jgi:hypothetical protein
MDALVKGAVATAVASASGSIIALPTVDPSHFSPVTLHGALHLFGFIVWSIAVSEARYWKAWADKFTGNGTINGGSQHG